MSTFSPELLRAICIITGFKSDQFHATQAAMIYLGLRGNFCAADIPADITRGDTHMAGAATAGLVVLGLIQEVGRIKSPNPNAHGRKLSVFTIPTDKLVLARMWLERQGFPQGVESKEEQADLFEGALR